MSYFYQKTKAMKNVITTTVFLLICGTILAQDRTKDEVAINKQIDAMIYSWNNHNYDDMNNYTTENTDWVNVVGMWWKGRKESQYAHQAYHNTFLKTSVAEKKAVFIRFLTEDVAIAHLECLFSGGEATPDGKKPTPNDDLATLVYVKQNGKWLMTAGENVHIDKGAQQFDPVNQMPKN
jgi:uncharacterized protein (TIGR02246 family)